jgi:hypothetical protein
MRCAFPPYSTSVEHGIEDIEAGKYLSFPTAEAASEYLEALTEQILARDDADELRLGTPPTPARAGPRRRCARC